MIFLLLFIFALPGFFIGKYIFKSWFNPVTIYTAIWYGMLNLYYIKLIRYEDLDLQTWLYIAGAYFSLILGSVTIYLAFKLFNIDIHPNKDVVREFKLVVDNGKAVKIFIIIFSIVGFISAFQHWHVLIQKYGSVLEVLLKANEIYRLRIEGKIIGVIPYLHVFAYVGVFLSAIYAAYTNKLSFIIFLPLIAVFIKEIANVGRSGILYSVVLFGSTYFIIKLFYNFHLKKTEKKILRTVLLLSLVLAFFIGSSVIMRTFRGTVESFTGTSKALSSYKDNLLISPSIYLYLSAHVGVFNKYLEMDVERSKFAQYTFQPVYNILAKFGVTDKTKFYHHGYFIPVWVNTGTYLREVHADFGIWGLILIPYFLGFFAVLFWYRFFSSGNSLWLILLVQLFSIIFFSFFLSITRFGVWYISLILLLVFVPVIEYIATFNYKKAVT